MVEPPKNNLICDSLQSDDMCGLTPTDIDRYQSCLPAGK